MDQLHSLGLTVHDGLLQTLNPAPIAELQQPTGPVRSLHQNNHLVHDVAAAGLAHGLHQNHLVHDLGANGLTHDLHQNHLLNDVGTIGPVHGQHLVQDLGATGIAHGFHQNHHPVHEVGPTGQIGLGSIGNHRHHTLPLSRPVSLHNYRKPPQHKFKPFVSFGGQYNGQHQPIHEHPALLHQNGHSPNPTELHIQAHQPHFNAHVPGNLAPVHHAGISHDHPSPFTPVQPIPSPPLEFVPIGPLLPHVPVAEQFPAEHPSLHSVPFGPLLQPSPQFTSGIH